MLTIPLKPPAELAFQLMTHYSFDLGGYKAHELINRWQSEYPVNWLHLAVIEALYQGRYKGISVQQILNFWQRKGEATYHFNMEFERMICSKFPQKLTSPSLAVLPPVNKPAPVIQELPVIEKRSKYQLLPAQARNDYQEQPVTSADFETINHHSRNELVTTNVSKQVIEEQPSIENYQMVSSANANHPPIGQFTPQKSDRIESFTSKLKSMTTENLEFVF